MGTEKQLLECKARAFCFTYNNYSISDIKGIQTYLAGLTGCTYIFQEETGETGTKHLQGYIRFRNPRGFSWQKKMSQKIHWEIAKKGKQTNIDYCSKAETRTGSMFTNMELPEEVKDPLADHPLHAWQMAMEERVLGPRDDRKIVWVTDEVGGAGKTAFCKHMAIKYGALVGGGAAKDIQYAIAAMKIKPKMVFWNLTRTQEGFVSYAGIEAVKDGIFFSAKYESAMVLFNSPHVVIFANFQPELEKLSKDRWHLINVKLFPGA